MIEKEMEYRGSKTIILEPKSTIVKEQRVDGSSANILALKCTLVGFERNYQVKILSNQINKKLFTSITTHQSFQNPLMNP